MRNLYFYLSIKLLIVRWSQDYEFFGVIEETLEVLSVRLDDCPPYMYILTTGDDNKSTDETYITNCNIF